MTQKPSPLKVYVTENIMECAEIINMTDKALPDTGTKALRERAKIRYEILKDIQEICEKRGRY